ncbi:hypothetical protein LTS08_005399 [Lithohypha guttulata]|uniref:Uncharacterized protein n=1 Tax=Lithohypha guttulata TaxID=1690604 RepID=A0AAN7YKI3_9EURO|nr:hypothetical protein LTR05_001823 [Lithohypha guttulata]KAK5100648.1 hypothetical protein LTS08_005399 [Lithohypha guttulata]
MDTPKPQRPVPGLPPTPPRSQNNSMHAQDSTGSSPMRSPMTSPPPQDMIPFRGIYQSPAPMSETPAYPTSISSQNTPGFNNPETRRRLQETWQQQQFEKRQQQQSRWQQQSPPMHMPPTPHQQWHHMPRDSGYGSTHNDYRHYGAYNGYSHQGSTPGPSPIPPQGNTYGAITASEDASVLLGNVFDKDTNPYSVAVHEYAGGHASDRAKIVGGNMDSNGMNNLFNRRRR